LIALTCAAALAVAGWAGAATTTKRVSVSSAEAQGDAASSGPALSPDARFIVFSSNASNLVPGDTNGQSDVFVRDRKTGNTKRVSVGAGGVQGDAGSFEPEVSANGRFVVFVSMATNLVSGDTNGVIDVFVRDRKLGATYRVSVGPGGAQADALSLAPSISANGRFVAFNSNATNLVGGDTNAKGDVFVRDRKAHKTTRVSKSTSGAQGDGFSAACYGYSPAISADGSIVAFQSDATNLVPGDTNAIADIFIRNRKTGTTRRVSVSRTGAQANDRSNYCSLSAGGRNVVFETDATNLVGGDTNGEGDVYVRNWAKKTTRRASLSSSGGQSTDYAGYAGISPDGRFVVFSGGDGGLVPHDMNGGEDVFVRDLLRRKTKRISRSSQASGSANGWISQGGHFVAFDSQASDHVGNDTNGVTDVFVRGRLVWP
jgi:Tol biopolymer transport system component